MISKQCLKQSDVAELTLESTDAQVDVRWVARWADIDSLGTDGLATAGDRDGAAAVAHGAGSVWEGDNVVRIAVDGTASTSISIPLVTESGSVIKSNKKRATD